MQCILCKKVLSNGSMFPAELWRHLEVTHPQCMSKEINFFKWKLHILTNCQSTMTKAAKTDHENATGLL
jgi:hypothetical protein